VGIRKRELKEQESLYQVGISQVALNTTKKSVGPKREREKEESEYARSSIK